MTRTCPAGRLMIIALRPKSISRQGRASIVRPAPRAPSRPVRGPHAAWLYNMGFMQRQRARPPGERRPPAHRLYSVLPLRPLPAWQGPGCSAALGTASTGVLEAAPQAGCEPRRGPRCPRSSDNRVAPIGALGARPHRAPSCAPAPGQTKPISSVAHGNLALLLRLGRRGCGGLPLHGRVSGPCSARELMPVAARRGPSLLETRPHHRVPSASSQARPSTSTIGASGSLAAGPGGDSQGGVQGEAAGQRAKP
jgi:hypothetical protein